MGQQQSKQDMLQELLSGEVSIGNVKGIKSVCALGASLNWVDKEGKTPLILACMKPELYNAAKTLIELGAYVHAYCPGPQAGTALHHAAERGVEQTVKLLLSHGANAFVINDDFQTPLEVARLKGRSNVVRAIESHLCLFSGWMREPYGPSFFEAFFPRKVWVTVLPSQRNLTKPFKFELAIYSRLQDSQPRTLIALWKANMEEPKFNQPDPAVIISDIPNKTRIKLVPANETDKELLWHFCNACKGIPQAPVFPATAPPSEDLELDMEINASIQPPMETKPPYVDANHISEASTSSSSQIATSPAPLPAKAYQGKEDTGGASSSCVICLDAPVEGACIPCGHVAGCMSCLHVIKGKKSGCPVCRTKIDQVVQLYAV